MAAELLHVDSGHQASPVFTIILSFSNTLLVQPICFIKAASACILEGLHTDVYHLYTKPFTWSKQTLVYSHILYCITKAICVPLSPCTVTTVTSQTALCFHQTSTPVQEGDTCDPL